MRKGFAGYLVVYKSFERPFHVVFVYFSAPLNKYLYMLGQQETFSIFMTKLTTWTGRNFVHGFLLKIYCMICKKNQSTRVNDHTTFFDFVLDHIWFLVIILGHIWFVWILGSHTRIIYDFSEIIQIIQKISKTKNCIILILYWSWKNFLELIQGHIWHIKHRGIDMY